MTGNGLSHVTTDGQLEKLLRQFKPKRRTIPISFRDRLPFLNNPDRFTHLIHPYPAKLLVHIPYFFLANSIISKPGDIILDPFCGSGTVLLEALLAGRSAVGADVNPLARLISNVKTLPLDPEKLRSATRSLKERIQDHSSTSPPDVVNLEYWFYPHVIKKLLCILDAINQTRDCEIRQFFLVCLSSCIRKVSLADPRLSVPVRLKTGQYPDGHWLREKTDQHLRKLKRVNVGEIFFATVQENTRRLVRFSRHFSGVTLKIGLADDSRSLKIRNQSAGALPSKIRSNSIGCVITSPPYVGSQKYTRATSLNLGWLGLAPSESLRSLESLSLGREHYAKESYKTPLKTGVRAADRALDRVVKVNPLRAHIAANYLLESRESFREIARVIRRGGYFVLIAADNQLCGLEFKVHEHLQTIAEESGFTLSLRLVDEIRSRGLMTKRNKTASLITREWVLLFEKN